MNIQNLIPMFTGEEVRLLRQVRGLMQKDMAHRMKVCQQRLSAIECSDKVGDEQVKKILPVLKFTAEEARKFLDNLPPH